MRRSKPLLTISSLYIVLLITVLLSPRKASVEPASASLLNKILHDLLFLSGPLEIFLNFLLFMPFFLVLSYVAPGLSRYVGLFISCLVSAAAELAQSQIVGRVSSLLDFFSNSAGVLFALIAISAMGKK